MSHWIDVARSTNPTRPNICQPFAVTIDGVAHRAATDGHVCLIATDDTAPVIESAPKNVADLFRRQSPEFVMRATVAELFAWASEGLPVTSPHDPCLKCKGTPPPKCRDCNGTGEVECDMGHEHECDRCYGSGGGCDECDGTGKRGPEFMRGGDPATWGAIGPCVIDRRKFAAIFGAAPAGNVALSMWQPLDPILIDGDGWKGAVMPIRADAAARAAAKQWGQP